MRQQRNCEDCGAPAEIMGTVVNDGRGHIYCPVCASKRFGKHTTDWLLPEIIGSILLAVLGIVTLILWLGIGQ